MTAKVAILKTAPGTVIEDYGRLMRLAGYQDVLSPSAKTVLKINLSWDLWFPACSTAPWQLEGVIRALLNDGFDPDSLMLAVNRPPDFNGRAGEINNGLAAVAERYGLDFTRLYEPPVNWITFEPKAELLVIDRLFERDGIQIPDLFLETNIIHLPTLRTDLFSGTAGAMHNALGGIVSEDGRRPADVIHEVLVDLLAVQQEIHGGLFAVMDGALCGDGPGPRAMIPYEKGYIIAGADQVALDAVAAKMMGFEPMELKYIRLAHERGLGCGAIDEIEIVGEDITGINFHFQGSGGEAGGSRLQGPRPARCNSVESALLRSAAPWSHAASRLYYDLYWYPFIGRRRVDDLAETKWGQLLQTYLPPGAELETQGGRRGSLIALAAGAVLLGMSAAARVSRLARRR